VWRCAFVIMVGVLCLRSIKRGNVLPALLFSSSFMPFISGQFGQPTILGFAVFTTGLALAAMKGADADDPEEGSLPPAAPMRPLPRRSPYAERLHGAGAGAATTQLTGP
jgi:hypothetical protein